MLPTIKDLAPKIERFNLNYNRDYGYMNKKDYCKLVASTYKDICRFTESVLTDFKEVKITFVDECLYFDYPAGSAKITTHKVEQSILLPLIEDIAFKHGNRIVND